MNNEFKPFASFGPSGFSGRATQMNEFISRRHHTLLDAGDAQRNQLDTVEKVEAHAKKMRETFIEKIGGIPERDCPLDAKVTNVIDHGHYTIESIIFRARKGAYVTASLYILITTFFRICVLCIEEKSRFHSSAIPSVTLSKLPHIPELFFSGFLPAADNSQQVCPVPFLYL